MRLSRLMLVGVILLALMVPIAGVRAQQAGGNATITWGEDIDLNTLDPRVSSYRHEGQVIMNVFDALVFVDTDGKAYPWLAESWEYSKDGKSVTFRLRKDVKFHDGTPFNAEAVKLTLDTIVDPKTASTGAIDFIGPYDSTEVIDPYTAKVNWKQPFAPAVTNLSNNWLFGIVSPTAVKKLGNKDFAHNPIGTGPFKFVEWVPRVRVVTERNEDYKWAPKVFKHQGPPYAAKVVFRIIPDASTRVSALETGEIDVADAVPPIEVKRFQGSRDYDVMIGHVPGTPMMYLLNITKAPTDDLRVRQAFMYGIDRVKLTQQVFFGVAKPAYGPLSFTTPGYWSGAEKMYPYNVAKARQLLDDAGWKDGPGGIRVKNGKSLELNFPVEPITPEFAEAVQGAIKEIGIKLNVVKTTFAKQDEMVLKNEWYHVTDLRWPSMDPSILDVVYLSKTIPVGNKYGFNWSRIASPELDRMLMAADGAIDPKVRVQRLADVQKWIMERALMFPAYTQFQVVGYRRSVQNLKYAQGSWQLLFYDAVKQ